MLIGTNLLYITFLTRNKSYTELKMLSLDKKKRCCESSTYALEPNSAITSGSVDHLLMINHES